MNRKLFWVVFVLIMGMILNVVASLIINIIVFVLTILFSVYIIIRYKRKHLIFIICLLIAFNVGFFRMYFYESNMHIFVEKYTNQTSVLKGTAHEPVITDTGKLRFLLNCNEIITANSKGKVETVIEVVCDDSRGINLNENDKVSLTGMLEEPRSESYRGGFDYKGYLKSRGVYTCLYITQEGLAIEKTENGYNAFYEIRNWIKALIDKYIPNQEGELTKGILIGERSGFSEQLNDDLIKSGTVHIVAVSGMQVSVLIMFVVLLCRLLGIMRKTSGIIGIIAVICFVFVAGFQASVVRAGIMGIIFLLGMVLFRKADAMTSLAVSAGILTLYNPFVLYDVAFQLTFVSTFGILILYEPICKLLGFVPPFFKEALAVSISAQLFTAPLVVWNFSNVSVISLIANIIVVPYVDLIFIVTLIFLAVAPLWNILGVAVGYVIKFMSALVLYSIKSFANLPYSYFSIIKPEWWAMGIYFSLVAILALMLLNINRKISYIAPILAFLTFSSIGTVQAVGDRDVVNVGFTAIRQFTCSYAKPNNTNGVILLSGWDYKGLPTSKTVIDYLRKTVGDEFEAIIVTEINETQVDCLKTLINKMKIKKLILPDITFGNPAVAELCNFLRNNNTQTQYIKMGDAVAFENGIRLKTAQTINIENRNKIPLILECNSKNFGYFSGYGGKDIAQNDFTVIQSDTKSQTINPLNPNYAVIAGWNKDSLLFWGNTKAVFLSDVGSVKYKVHASGKIEEMEYHGEK